MSGFEVGINRLRSAAKAAEDLGGQLKQVDLAAPVAGLRAAIPGSASGPALEDLAEVWRGAVDRLSADAIRYAGDLRASADHYSANEAAAEADLRLHGSGMRPV